MKANLNKVKTKSKKQKILMWIDLPTEDKKTESWILLNDNRKKSKQKTQLEADIEKHN